MDVQGELRCFLRRIRNKSTINPLGIYGDWPETTHSSPSGKHREMIEVTTPSGPSGWNRISAMQFDGERAGDQDQIMLVSGVPVVRQPVKLARDEWVCGGCLAPIIVPEGPIGSDGHIEHQAGCPAIADIAKAVRG